MTTDSSGARRSLRAGALGRRMGVSEAAGARTGCGTGTRLMGLLPSSDAGWLWLGREYSPTSRVGATPTVGGVLLAPGDRGGQNDTRAPRRPTPEEPRACRRTSPSST